MAILAQRLEKLASSRRPVGGHAPWGGPPREYAADSICRGQPVSVMVNAEPDPLGWFDATPQGAPDKSIASRTQAQEGAAISALKSR